MDSKRTIRRSPEFGDGAKDAIADLNTHLGLQGTELQMVAEAALKAKVDTNLFGDVASQMGLDAKGAAELLDQLTVASQGSGVSIDAMTQGIGRNSARWVNAGGDMKDLTAKVVELSFESGPSGLRGAMSEVFEEVDKGLMPAIVSLETQLVNTTGAVERTYGAGKTWRDTIRETKDAAIAYLGPAGDMVGAIGSAASGLALAGPAMMSFMTSTKLAKLAMGALNFVMNLNPIGLLVVAIGGAVAAYVFWKDEIDAFLANAWNVFIGAVESGIEFLRPFADLIGIDLPSSLGGFKIAVMEAETETGTFEEAVGAVSGALAGDQAGVSLAPSAEEAEAALAALRDETGRLLRKQEDAILVTDKQWVAYQNLWPEADKNADILSSKMIPALSTLSMTGLPEVSAGLVGPGGVAKALETTGSAATTFLDTMATAISPDNITSIFTAAFTGAGGALGALKAIGSQLVGALSKHFLTPLSTSIFNGVKGIFTGGKLASTGMDLGAGTGAGAAGGGLGFTGVIAAIPGWGWAAAGFAAAAIFISSFRNHPGLPALGSPEMRQGIANERQVMRETGGVVDTGFGTEQVIPNLNYDPFAPLKPGVEFQTDPYRKRHRGGPVSAGQSYSTIPGEVFTPSTNGRIDNPGLIDYDKLGAAVAAALQRSPLHVSRDAVTDAMLENAPRRQALHGTA